MIKLAAIIPAAGLSSRMGDFKPLLSLGDGTVLSQCIDVFCANDVEQIIVVTGKRGEEVAAAAQQAGADSVHNTEFEKGMYSSVLAGVHNLRPDIEAFFMLPVDIPLVRKATVARLIAMFQEQRPVIMYPRFNGERGHPPLISREVLPEIFSHDGAGGLRTVLDRCESDACDLDVADFGSVHDLDRWSDYELAQSLVGTPYPSDDECTYQ